MPCPLFMVLPDHFSPDEWGKYQHGDPDHLFSYEQALYQVSLASPEVHYLGDKQIFLSIVTFPSLLKTTKLKKII